MHFGAKIHHEELHLQELGISTLTACFVNSNRDSKSESAKPSEFFYFNPIEVDEVQIPASTANAFFYAADNGLLPGWAVAIAPVQKLKSAKTNTPVRDCVVWVGEKVVLISPKVDGKVVRFAIGFVDDAEDAVRLDCGLVVDVGRSQTAWILDGVWTLNNPPANLPEGHIIT